MSLDYGAADAARQQEARKRKAKSKAQSTPGNGTAPPVDITKLCLTPAAWRNRIIPPQDLLMGHLLSTTTRTQFSADTGLGKTMIGLALNHAMRLKADFLHWKAHRQSSVLIIDGEMPLELIKTRLDVAASWFGATSDQITDGFFLLSREDVEDMPPLDTPEGARLLLDFISKLGRVDHATFDNIASLTGSCLKEEDGVRFLHNLQRDLTQQRIGQLWLHHTGHDTTRAYGPKMRSWHLDTDMVGERLDRPDTDVAFTLKFSKARRRTPENRADFEEIEITLAHGRWEYGNSLRGDPNKPLGANQQIVFDAATKILAGSTAKAPPGHPAAGKPVAKVDTIRDAKNTVVDPRHFSSRFNAALNSLTNAHRLHHHSGFVWL